MFWMWMYNVDKFSKLSSGAPPNGFSRKKHQLYGNRTASSVSLHFHGIFEDDPTERAYFLLWSHICYKQWAPGLLIFFHCPSQRLAHRNYRCACQNRSRAGTHAFLCPGKEPLRWSCTWTWNMFILKNAEYDPLAKWSTSLIAESYIHLIFLTVERPTSGEISSEWYRAC